MDQTTVTVNGSDMKLTNGSSTMESEPESDAFSDSGDLVSELNADKLDPADRVLYEKLKQQEREEREEIERELKEQQDDSYGISKQQIRAREQEIHLAQERMQQRSEQRELDLTTAGNPKFPVGSGGVMADGNNSFSDSGNVTNDKNTSSGSGGNGGNSSSGGGSGGNGSIGSKLNHSINNNTPSNNNSNGNANVNSNSTGTSGSTINNIADSFLSKMTSPPMNLNHKPPFLLGGENNITNVTKPEGIPPPPPGSKFMPEELRAHLGLQNATTNFLSSLPLGHPLAHAHLALGGHLLGREGFKGLDGMNMNNVMNPFHPIMSNHSAAFPSPPSPAEPPYPPASTTPHSPTGSLQPSPSPDDPNGENRSHNWTFEEQFKQLYELSDDPKRKEFLDDLFAFMQKRGTPVNRIPIMAKQTLDLYELFRLVVSKGGLVEVINKKLWREITKGLNLPSSITSAAFTLRTQYMKYLYPYECEKMKLSNPSELQAAIDGNRREGRRSSYGYDLSPGPTLVPSNHPLNGGGVMNGKLGRASPLSFDGDRPDIRHLAGSNPQGLTFNPALMPLSHHIYSTMMSEKLRHSSPIEDESLPPTPLPAHHRGMTERDALAMEAASRAMEDATRKMEAATRAGALDEGPPRKRLITENDRIPFPASMPNAHFKITSRNDGRSEIDTSLVVSMEINGIMYQGVLFAQHPPRIGV